MNKREFLKYLLKIGILASAPSFSLAQNKRILLVYYTRTLNTHILVLFIQSILKCDILRLESAEIYPTNYDEMVTLAQKQKQEKIFVKLAPYSLNLSAYTHILIASPLWGLSLSTPIKSFLKNHDFENKFLTPIITNAGWGFGNSINEIKNLTKATILQGLEYEFKLKEKITRNLKQYNENLISQNNAFEKLDKEKIINFLQRKNYATFKA